MSARSYRYRYHHQVSRCFTLKRNRNFSTLERTVSTLGVWHNAVEKIPPEAIIPGKDNKCNNDPKLAAFVGDKILGASFARWIQKKQRNVSSSSVQDNADTDVYDQGSASILASVVLSNEFMADRLSQILPNPVHTEWARQANLGQHKLGTLVEAAVAAVDDHAAVENLVEWLIEQGQEADKNLFNPKGTLLRMGGSIEVDRHGGTDHNPRFLATAVFQNFHVEATGRTKKIAEQSAASQCLVQVRDGGVVSLNSKEEDEHVTFASPIATETWTPFDFGEEWSLTLKNGESILDWWQRGTNEPRKAFRRALFGPKVFPESVLSVDSWTRRYESTSEEDDDSVVASIVIVFDDKKGENGTPNIVFWSTAQIASSANKARSMAGLDANAEISRLVGFKTDG
ncbi:expressed unknown protein [Seminavis robusta]|uniref:DRBM domain-containing protein n=1 Tax=Seminavis robusta TaxID=568900 RepID=A0A9N8H296_9STRA|nr:expressed unknown protein [Seminavis robusta]|eukprot:Sro5_g004690.1 n/a (399) ;mRNA; r:225057-226253